MSRPIYEVASEIRKLWAKPYFGAVPYLDAMGSLSDKYSKYMYDDAVSIVTYFLSNATTFRGEDAKRLKKELKEIVGIK